MSKNGSIRNYVQSVQMRFFLSNCGTAVVLKMDQVMTNMITSRVPTGYYIGDFANYN
jgi:hypothetical protein